MHFRTVTFTVLLILEVCKGGGGTADTTELKGADEMCLLLNHTYIAKLDKKLLKNGYFQLLYS